MSSHHPQEVFLAQSSLYVHKSGLKPDSFYFLKFNVPGNWTLLEDHINLEKMPGSIKREASGGT